MEKTEKEIKWLIADVDGTMTDGGIFIDAKGTESKKFSVKDGAGILAAAQAGIRVVLLTGRESLCVTKRAQELHIPYVFQNVKKKKAFLAEFFEKEGIDSAQAAYIGDDWNDLEAMKLCGVSACPCDSAKEVQNVCTYVLEAKGGQGAVREFAELLIRRKGLLKTCIEELWG